MRLYAGLIALAVFLVAMAVNLEVPLYRTYAEAAGYGNGLTAVVFAGYIAGALPVLILLGGISDRIGRKPILMLGLGLVVVATGLVILAPNIYSLFLARLLQGLGVGLSVGTGTAYLAEVSGDPNRAANYVAVTTSLGFGGGALMTSVTLLFEKSLTPLSYWLVLGAGLACLLTIGWLPVRTTRQPGVALVRLPYYPSGTVPIGLAIGVAWAVTGLVIAVLPTQLALNDLSEWSGLALFMVNGSGVLLQPVARRLSSQRSLRLGFGLIPLGYALLVLGAWSGILGLVLLGSAVAGSACYGFTYLGGLAEVSHKGGLQRARAVSGYFLCAYLGFGLPAILIGFLADQFGVMNALLGFGVFILVMNLWLASTLKSSRAEG